MFAITVAITELFLAAREISRKKEIPLYFQIQKMILTSWNEQRGKENKLKMTIDELIEYKNGLPIPQYSNPAISDTL